VALYTGSDIDGDLARAVLAKWNATEAITAAVPGGIGQEPLAATPATPYATLEIDPGSRADEFTTGSQQVVYRDVVIRIRATSKADAMRLGGLANAKVSTLTLDGLMRLEPQKGKIETPKGERKGGEQSFLATVRFTAWVHWDRSGLAA